MTIHSYLDLFSALTVLLFFLFFYSPPLPDLRRVASPVKVSDRRRRRRRWRHAGAVKRRYCTRCRRVYIYYYIMLWKRLIVLLYATCSTLLRIVVYDIISTQNASMRFENVSILKKNRFRHADCETVETARKLLYERNARRVGVIRYCVVEENLCKIEKSQ